MDERKKRALLQGGLARMTHSLGQRGVSPFAGEPWVVPTDIYETDQAFVVYLDLAGVEPAAIQVIVEETRLTVSGERHYSPPETVRQVHQLEIEQGHFAKRINLPTPIEVEAAETRHRHGFLMVVLPKQRPRRVKIEVR